jgi:hypothetical protein
MLYCAVPFTLPGTSTRVTSVPTRRHRALSSGSSTISGAFAGIFANAAISPYVRRRPDFACTTTPGSVASSESGTFQCCAALSMRT